MDGFSLDINTYQGGVFSTDGTSGTTTDFDGNEIKYTPLSSTSYGKAAGLFGINCGHMASPFIGGFSDLTYEQYPDKEANDKLYKERQEQRRLEREVRKTKNTLLLADESGLRGTDEYINSARKLRRQKNTLNSYAEKHNLRVDNKRLQVAEYGHSASAKAVWTERKSVDKSNNVLYNKSMEITYEPMPKEQFDKIKSAFEKNGGVIKIDNESERHLLGMGAEGATLGSDIIILKRNPARAVVFEELIHTTQYKNGEFDGTPLSIAKSEVAAKEKLLKHAKAYKLTDLEIKSLHKLLEKDKKSLKNILEGV